MQSKIENRKSKIRTALQAQAPTPYTPHPTPCISRPHILFVTEKWCDGNPEMGLTLSEHNLWSTLAGSGLATCEHFFYDEYYREYGTPGDEALLELCARIRPDMLFFSYTLCAPHNPTVETLHAVRDRWNIPVVMIWWDSIHPLIAPVAERYLAASDLHVLVDADAFIHQTDYPEKCLRLWCPLDTALFHDPCCARDIALSHVGSVAFYPHRQSGLAALRAAGIEVYEAGGQREHKLTREEYARTLQRSKITLNFADIGTAGVTQTKARIFEAALCGAMLLESDNPGTAAYLKPMVDYVPFSDEADLIDKARYYRAHDAERADVAINGCRKAQLHYTGTTFWRSVLEAAGLLPFSTEARSKQAGALLEMGRNAEAMFHSYQLAAQTPDSADAYCRLGQALSGIGWQREAERAFEQALHNCLPAFIELANLRRQQGRVDEAIGLLEQAIPDPETNALLSAFCLQSGQARRAVAHFKKLAQRRPQDLDAHLKLGEALFAAGNLRAAETALQMANRLDPEAAMVHNDLAVLYWQIGEWDRAIVHMQLAVRHDPDSPEIVANAAVIRQS